MAVNVSTDISADEGSATDMEDSEVEQTKAERWRRTDLDGVSLISQTLEELENDSEYQRVTKKLAEVGLEGLTKEERTRRRRALEGMGVPSFPGFLKEKGLTPILKRHAEPEILQLNIGLYCNQACAHCHVESSPLRKETMTQSVSARCLELLAKSPSVHTLDLTGGAPELNGEFRYLVAAARDLRPDITIIDRCNLTVLQEPGQEDLVDFLEMHKVRVVASLPCYGEENVDAQRGRGVFDRSIAALLKLNEAGYGSPDRPDLHLDLVYNPSGAFLPPTQAQLEPDYKRELEANFGILFDSLLTITNMPIKRFADYLHRKDELKSYMELLVDNFNGDTIAGLMCLNTVSVGYDGKIYDCDFNQQLGMPIGQNGDGGPEGLSIFGLESLADLQKYNVRTDNHCFGCTAGSGSSCQGATA